MKTIEGERIILREWKDTDLHDLYEYAILENVGPNAGWKPHKNIYESKIVLKKFIDSREVYAIELKKERKVIGSIGFHTRLLDEKYKDFKQKEIAIVLNPQYWGKEYAKEAINLLINYGFVQLQLDFIWICHHEENEKSKKMIKKCNFQYIFEKDILLERLNNKKVKMIYYIKTKNITNNE